MEWIRTSYSMVRGYAARAAGVVSRFHSSAAVQAKGPSARPRTTAMYAPPPFRTDDVSELHAMMRETRLATLITATAEGPVVTPVPLILVAEEGTKGVLYGHIARANPHWTVTGLGPTLAFFMGPDAYVSPSWYATKKEHGKVVPTWNYTAVEATGKIEFFDDPARLLAVVTQLTDMHESGRPAPWKVDDAPEEYVAAHLRGIIGVRLPIDSLTGKRKVSQNRCAADRAGVAAGLAESQHPADRAMAALIPQ